MPKRVLVVDDDVSLRSFLATILREEEYIVREAGDGKEALRKLEEVDAHLVFLDLRMPGPGGLDVLNAIRKGWPSTRVVMMTAYAEVETAVQALKAGASDYLTKPFQSPGEIRVLAKRLLEQTEVSDDLAVLSDHVQGQMPPLDLIFQGAIMQSRLELSRSVAPTDATVLITGESGTGKELVAKVIHQLSPRRHRALVSVHCAALSENLLESELFGHERGAFTGATQTRKGRFELADGGTLFLDEIGEITPPVQVKLLRVIQERVFERVGGNTSLQVDTRLIAATNRDLKTESEAGRFRNDLYFRLNVFPIHLPPLRERRDAILPLADYFLKKFRRNFGKSALDFHPNAKDAMMTYSWPGNIRELENIVERSAIIAREIITPDMIPSNHHRAGPAIAVPTVETGVLEQQEREVILKILQDCAGNRTLAAKRLGISRRTLQYRLKAYGIN